MKTNLEPGDIGAVKGTGALGWISRNLATPTTDRLHHFIVWGKMDSDYLILESIGSKGLTMGKLSWYKDEDVIFYRVNCDQVLRETAPCGLIDYGRSRYDYLLVLKVLVWALQAWVKMLIRGKLRKLSAEDFPYKPDRSLVCTEAVETAYLSVGVQVIDPGVLPLPSAFKESEMQGKIYRV